MAPFQVVLTVFSLLAMAQAGLPNLPPASPVEAQARNGDYGFRYSVNDFNGNEHSHQQTRNGNAVTGQYKVLLPDGRLQTVTYVADAAGYRAKVDYTPAAPGEATTAGINTPATEVLPGAGAVQPVAPIAPTRNVYPSFPQLQNVGNFAPGLSYYSPFSYAGYLGNNFNGGFRSVYSYPQFPLF